MQSISKLSHWSLKELKEVRAAVLQQRDCCTSKIEKEALKLQVTLLSDEITERKKIIKATTNAN